MICLDDAPKSLEERVYRMRLRQPWVRISRCLGLPIEQLQALAARYLKERGGARTPETLLGPNT
jgi:hypothetical protein